MARKIPKPALINVKEKPSNQVIKSKKHPIPPLQVKEIAIYSPKMKKSIKIGRVDEKR
jgi:hypothetical protein